MKTIEMLAEEIESLRKDNTEIKKRLDLIEDKKTTLTKKEEIKTPEFVSPSSIAISEKAPGLTRQGSWLLIIFGGVLCLTGIGIIFGLPLLIWGIVSLSKSNKNRVAINQYNLQNEINLTPKEKVFESEIKNVATAVTVEKVEGVFTPPIKPVLAENAEPVAKKVFSFEEEIGMKWFSRIGVLALVIGVGFFIKYAVDMDWINHLARIIFGVIFGSALIVYGEIISKKTNYAKWGKTLVGGGLAITYFCVYVAYYFESYRQAIGMNQILDLFLMVGVVSVAVVLSLRDNSQVIAAESFFLGYVTALLNDNFELVALFYTLLLTAGLVVVVSYKKWPAIGLGGVGASYLMYILWNANNQEIFSYAALILIFYFISFTLQSFFFSKKKELEVDNILITLINSALFFSLFYAEVKKFYPDYCGWLTLALAVIYLGGFVFYKKLNIQALAKTHLYLGIFFATLTVPIYFNRELVSIIWSLEALFLAMLYIKTNSSILKLAFNLLSVFIFFKSLTYDLVNLRAMNLDNFFQSTRLISVGVTIVCFYLIYGVILKNRNLIQNFKTEALMLYSWAASSLLVLIIFVELGEKFPAWTTVVLAGLVIIFMLLGNRVRGREFFYQANTIASIIFLKLLFYDSSNLSSFNPENILSSNRLGVFLAVSVIFYGVYAYLRRISILQSGKNTIANIYSWLAMSLILLIIFIEFSDDYLAKVSVGLGCLMLIYFFVSKVSIKELLYQAVAISQILFVKVLFFDAVILKELKMSPSFLDSRFVSLLAASLSFYMVSIYLNSRKEKLEEKNKLIAGIYSYYGTFLAFLLIMLEMKDYWISVGWSILALFLISMGFVLSRKSLRIQGIIIFTISIFKVFIYDIQGLEVIYRTISYIALGVILLTVSFMYNKYKDKLKEII
ncbi:MAG: hypothetical protein ACD_7C00310G0009 [uncultured bacterium]|nr:MAG: hypothetical protein ACD_7C00310G0009 [uncultured bacterium]HBR79499.1 hypothetical protein [Candidatus Moranbacteria bacterium]